MTLTGAGMPCTHANRPTLNTDLSRRALKLLSKYVQYGSNTLHMIAPRAQSCCHLCLGFAQHLTVRFHAAARPARAASAQATAVHAWDSTRRLVFSKKVRCADIIEKEAWLVHTVNILTKRAGHHTGTAALLVCAAAQKQPMLKHVQVLALMKGVPVCVLDATSAEFGGNHHPAQTHVETCNAYNGIPPPDDRRLGIKE